jgi:rhombotail lipoprotein
MKVSLASTLPLLALCAGCGAGPNHAPRAPEPSAAAAAPAPAVLQRSLFTKDAVGALTEADLQKVLEAPVDLQFPARVGVVPLAHPFDPAGPVDVATRSIASQKLASTLVGAPYFSHVSDVSTDLPNVGGIEGLRALAARYRLRYLLLYSETFEDQTHLNGWAWLYPTVLGMFVAPGVTVRSQGIAQADLLDVRTGTVLFSVVEPMVVSEVELMVGAGRSHRDLQASAAAAAAKALAKRVSLQTNALVAFADSATHGDDGPRTRILPAPIALHASP